MRRLWELSNLGSCLRISTYDLSWGQKLINLVDRLAHWLREKPVIFAAILGFVASFLCAKVITDAPLFLLLAQSACFLPLWICVFWPSIAAIRNAIINKSISGFALGTVFLVTVGGLLALSFVRDLYRGVAAELEFRDATGASKDLIQAVHLQANELKSLALNWAVYGFVIGMLFLLFFGVIWVWRSFVEIAAIKESPELDKDRIFVVGDRGL